MCGGVIKGYKLTTIVYNHKERAIGFDSRVTSGRIIDTDNHMKMVVTGDKRWFFSGTEAHRNMFIASFVEGNKCAIEFDCGAFLVEGGDVYYCSGSDGVFSKTHLTWNDAAGSGACFAIAALDFGLSAKEAVKYAATKDSATGGKIRVFNVTKHKFN